MPHQEQNDALKANNKIAVQRYKFATKCIGAKKRILDLGCGMGYGREILEGMWNEVVGVDRSEKAIEYAREHYPGEYRIVDLEKDEIDQEGFDTVVCLETLCHLKDPQKFIDKIKVKELVISAPIDPSPLDGYHYRLHNLSREQFRAFLKDWEVVDKLIQKQYLVLYCKKI